MKKVMFFIASLFLVVGAMAQSPINSADFNADNKYRIYNKAASKGDASWMAIAPKENHANACLKAYDADDETQLWQFIPSDGKYYIYNVATKKYLGAVQGNTTGGAPMVASQSSAQLYTMEKHSDGERVALYHSADERHCLWNDGGGNLYGWKDDNDPCHLFYLANSVPVIKEVNIIVLGTDNSTAGVVYNNDVLKNGATFSTDKSISKEDFEATEVAGMHSVVTVDGVNVYVSYFNNNDKFYVAG